MSNNKSIPLPVRVDEELYKEARECGINVSSVVRAALVNEIFRVKLGDASCVSELTRIKNKDGSEILTIVMKS